MCAALSILECETFCNVLKLNKIGKFTSRCILYCSKFPTPIARLFDIADFQLSYRLSVLSGLSGFFSAFILTCTFTLDSPRLSCQKIKVWRGMKIVQIIFTIKFSNVVCVALAICIYLPATASAAAACRSALTASSKIRTQMERFSPR